MEQTITLSEFLHKNRTKIHRPGMYVWYMHCCVGNAIQAVVFCFRNMEVTVRTQTVAQGCGRRFLSHVNHGRGGLCSAQEQLCNFLHIDGCLQMQWRQLRWFLLALQCDGWSSVTINPVCCQTANSSQRFVDWNGWKWLSELVIISYCVACCRFCTRVVAEVAL